MTEHPRRLPLRGYPVLRSSDFDEVRSFLSNKRIAFLAKREKGGALRARIYAAYLPNMYLSYVDYGTPVALGAAETRGDFGIQIPVRGQLRSFVGRTEVDCDPRRAVIGSPNRLQTTWSSADCGRLLVAISRDALVQHLSALLGEAIAEPLVFDPSMSLVDGHGSNLADYVRLAVDDLDREGSLLAHPLMARQFEQLIFTGLLISQPSNYSSALDRQSRLAVTPRDLRRVMEYIHAHADRALMTEDLVAAAGVPGRTLHKHFREFLGLSPMAYVRKVRLERAREALLRGDPALSVTEIALRWGFTHLGRFSAYYRHAFGESPSETARKRRH